MLNKKRNREEQEGAGSRRKGGEGGGDCGVAESGVSGSEFACLTNLNLVAQFALHCKFCSESCILNATWGWGGEGGNVKILPSRSGSLKGQPPMHLTDLVAIVA